MLAVKRWFASDRGLQGASAWYREANCTHSLPNITINLHAGYNYGDYWTDFGGR